MKATPFRDDSTPVKMHWYVTEQDAPGLPFPTSYMSMDWMTYPWQKTRPGEIWLEPRKYNGDWGMAGRVSNHICGSEQDFLDGCVLDFEEPEVQYDANGNPTCCDTLCGVGGVSWGGSAKVSLKIRYRTYYGISYSGRYVLGAIHYVTASGGISYGGTALARGFHRVIASGGVSWGGTALQRYKNHSTGGVSWGGTAVVRQLQLVTASGGVSWGGTAIVSTIPAPPPPGLVCALAPTVSLGILLPFTTQDHRFLWYKWNVLPGMVYHMTYVNTDPGGYADIFVNYSDCGFNYLQSITTGCLTITTGTQIQVCMASYALINGAAASVRLDTGPC